MALSRRTGQRFQASIWPGFVDAMTGLLLVLMFVLTIFMIVQFVLRETISGQESELNNLQDEIALIAEALGLEKKRTEKLGMELNSLAGDLANTESEIQRQATLISTLTREREEQAELIGEANLKITRFEAQVAGLLSQRENLNLQIGSLKDDQKIATKKILELKNESENFKSDRDRLELALASARNEIDAATQAARMAAAQREVFESMIAALEQDLGDAEKKVTEKVDEIGLLQEKLSKEEEARLVSAAVAEELRERLKNADAELTAMTLMLEKQRKEAEDTLTLLAAANNAREKIDEKLKETLFALEAASIDIFQKKQSIEKLETAEKQISTKLDETNFALAAALSRGENLEQELSDTKESSEKKLMVILGEKTEIEKNNAELRKNLENALVARLAADAAAQSNLEEAKRKQLLLEQAEQEIEEQAIENKKSNEELIKAERQTALLNQQLSEVRKQLGELDELLSISEERDQEQKAQLKNVGSRLNQALASLASEERKRRKLEENERKRLEEERKRLEEENSKLTNQAEELANYKSEFFGRMRKILKDQERVSIVGDRFIFSSEVLFSPGSSNLSTEGKAEISNVTESLSSIMKDIPDNIDWVIRVDGHTDDVPLSGVGEFKDNWELSQARALSVVKYMITELNFSGSRLAANGFGEYQPISAEDTPEARAQNRRIEIKLTER